MNDKTKPSRKSRRKKNARKPASFHLFADTIRQICARDAATPAVEAITIRFTAESVQVIRIDVRAGA